MARNQLPALGRVGLVYFLLAVSAIELTRFGGGVALLWFANAYLIAELGIVRRREWPRRLAVAALASILATGLFGLGWGAAVPMAAANLVEAALAAYLLRRQGAGAPLESLAWFGRFTLAVAIAAPLGSAAIAGVVALFLHLPPVDTMVHFYTGHALGNLTFAPLFLLMLRGELTNGVHRLRQRRGEALGLVGLAMLTAAVCFAQQAAPLLFLPILPIILVTFRLGRGAAVVSILGLALIGGGMTLAGLGPIQMLDAGAGAKAQFFQFYLAATVLTVWPVAADLRNRARLHGRLQLSEAHYRLIADHSSDVLMKLDRSGCITYVSPSVRQLGNYDPQALLGTASGQLIAPADRERVSVCHQIVMVEPERTHSFEYQGLTADGEPRWFETHSRAVLDGRGEAVGTLSIIRDVSARKATEQSLSRAARTDVLTGLPNRRAFAESVQQRTSRHSGGRDCIAILDIDHFKRVNDRHGHEAGDIVLRRFAAVARAAVRKEDFVARLGGEEFAILFPGTTVEQASAICERLRIGTAAMLVALGRDEIRITVSGGLAVIGVGGLDEALRVADAALYRAKDAGRDQLAIAA